MTISPPINTIAILELTDGTASGTVSLVGGPVYLVNWEPAGSEYKSGGIYLDSPVEDYRYIVSKNRANTSERFDVSLLENNGPNMSTLLETINRLLEDASTYWATRGRAGRRVWIKSQATSESQARYADIVQGRIPNYRNPFSQPHLQQTNCDTGESAVLQHEIQILIERTDWYDTAPAVGSALAITDSYKEQNLVQGGSFDKGDITHWYWTCATAGVFTPVYEDDDPSTHNFVLRVTSPSGTEGPYTRIEDLTNGDDYTFTARVRVVVGTGRMAAYNSSDVLFDAGTTFTSSEWTEISDTFTSPADGVIFLKFQAIATDDVIEVDWVKGGPDTFYGGIRTVGLLRDTTDEADAVGNYNLLTNLTHVYYYDDNLAAWSDNLIYEAPPFSLIPAGVTPAADDIIWFGSVRDRLTDTDTVHKETLGGNWASMVVDLQTGGSIVGANYLSNPGFETDATSWSIEVGSGSISRDTSNQRTGNGCGDFYTPIHTSSELHASLMSLVGGDTDLTFSAYVDPNGAATNSTMQLFIDWYTSGDVFISRDTGSVINLESYGSGYVYFETSAEAPVDAAKVRCGIILYLTYFVEPPVTITDIYIDDLVLAGESTTYTAQWVDSSETSMETGDFIDTTNYLKNSGVGCVTVNRQALGSAVLNSLNAWWLGFKFVTVPGTVSGLTVRTTPFNPYKNYVEINADDINGDGPADIAMTVQDLTSPPEVHAFFDTIALDAMCDDSAGTLDTSSATFQQDESDVVGVIFQSMNVPPNSFIRKAMLWVSPGGTDYNLTKALSLDIYGEKPGASGIPNWTTCAEMGSGGSRDITTASVTFSHDSMTVWAGVADVSRTIRIDVTSLVQEIVEDSNYVTYGTKMAFHIENNMSAASGELDWYTTNNTSNQSQPWGLEIEYVPTEVALRKLYIGSRTVDRGSLFQPQISFTNIPQDYIDIEGIPNASAGDAPNISGLSSRPEYVSDGTAQRFLRMSIYPPLSYSYSGRFRVFISGWLDHDKKFQLRYRAGRQSPVVHGDYYRAVDPQASSVGFRAFLDLGEMRIPIDREPNVLDIEIWSDAWTGYQYLNSIFLMPSDEWFGEFSIDGEEAGYGVTDDLEIFVDGITSPFGKPSASLRSISTGKDVSTIRSSTTQLQLYPGKTQRIYMLGLYLYDYSSDFSFESVPFPYSHPVYLVNIDKRSRYASFR